MQKNRDSSLSSFSHPHSKGSFLHVKMSCLLKNHFPHWLSIPRDSLHFATNSCGIVQMRMAPWQVLLGSKCEASIGFGSTAKNMLWYHGFWINLPEEKSQPRNMAPFFWIQKHPSFFPKKYCCSIFWSLFSPTIPPFPCCFAPQPFRPVPVPFEGSPVPASDPVETTKLASGLIAAQVIVPLCPTLRRRDAMEDTQTPKKSTQIEPS